MRTLPLLAIASLTVLASLAPAACSSATSSTATGDDGGANANGNGNGHGNGNADGGPSTGDGGPVTPPVRHCTGFASSPASWSVPGAQYGALAGIAGNEQWVTMDLDGDGHLDFVRTGDPASGGTKAFGAAGAAYWQKYAGGASGFASGPASWGVPDLAYYVTAQDAALGVWVTMDLDGDHHVDLVRTGDPKTGGAKAFGAAGAAYWELYKGGATGFAASQASWGVPDLAYYVTAANGAVGVWVTMDLDGDGHVDLVRTGDPKTGGAKAFGAAGAAYWELYKGGATGFAATPSQWGVPDLAYYVTTADGAVGVWITLDLDGDGHVDLVRTGDPKSGGAKAFGAAGAAYWELYKGGATGFASSPSQWSVPDPAYYVLTQNAAVGVWATMDLDGDHHLDLVLTQDRSAGHPQAFGTAGAAFWELYKGGATGFASSTTSWSVPDLAYDAVADLAWATLDLDGDGCPDLVRAADPTSASSGAYPGPSWHSFNGQ